MNQHWSFQIQSFIIVGLLILGIYYRRNRQKHLKFMITAIGWDLLLILQIEFSRQAILKASHFMNNRLLLNIHVSLAVSTVIFYIVMIITGRKILKGHNESRPYHRTFAMITFTLRILTLMTSFFAPELSS